MKKEHNSNYCNVQVNKKVGSGEDMLCPIWNQIFIHVLAIVFCRIVFSTRGKVIPLSVLFTKATFICIATTAASDDSSPSMARSAVVHCPLMSFGGWQALVIATTNQEQSKATVTTFTREKSVLGSTLETVLVMETLTVIQAGIQCPA